MYEVCRKDEEGHPWCARLSDVFHKLVIQWIPEEVDAVQHHSGCPQALYNQHHNTANTASVDK